MQDFETIAQAAADAAYNAVMSIADASTAPAQPVTLTAAPVMTQAAFVAAVRQEPQADGRGWEPADAYAAFRLAYDVSGTDWRATYKGNRDALTAIRAAQVAPYDRVAWKGQDGAKAAALAAFGLAAAPQTPAPAQTPQAAPVEPQAAPQGLSLTLPGTAPQAAPQAARKPQPAGTVALNGIKRYVKAHGGHMPASSAEVDPGDFAAVKAHVESERAQGHTVTADTVAVWIAAQSGK